MFAPIDGAQALLGGTGGTSENDCDCRAGGGVAADGFGYAGAGADLEPAARLSRRLSARRTGAPRLPSSAPSRTAGIPALGRRARLDVGHAAFRLSAARRLRALPFWRAQRPLWARTLRAIGPICALMPGDPNARCRLS